MKYETANVEIAISIDLLKQHEFRFTVCTLNSQQCRTTASSAAQSLSEQLPLSTHTHHFSLRRDRKQLHSLKLILPGDLLTPTSWQLAS